MYPHTGRTWFALLCLSPFFPFNSSLGQVLSLDSLENSLGVYKTILPEAYYESTEFQPGPKQPAYIFGYYFYHREEAPDFYKGSQVGAPDPTYTFIVP